MRENIPQSLLSDVRFDKHLSNFFLDGFGIDLTPKIFVTQLNGLEILELLTEQLDKILPGSKKLNFSLAATYAALSRAAYFYEDDILSRVLLDRGQAFISQVLESKEESDHADGAMAHIDRTKMAYLRMFSHLKLLTNMSSKFRYHGFNLIKPVLVEQTLADESCDLTERALYLNLLDIIGCILRKQALFSIEQMHSRRQRDDSKSFQIQDLRDFLKENRVLTDKSNSSFLFDLVNMALKITGDVQSARECNRARLAEESENIELEAQSAPGEKTEEKLRKQQKNAGLRAACKMRKNELSRQAEKEKESEKTEKKSAIEDFVRAHFSSSDVHSEAFETGPSPSRNEARNYRGAPLSKASLKRTARASKGELENLSSPQEPVKSVAKSVLPFSNDVLDKLRKDATFHAIVAKRIQGQLKQNDLIHLMKLAGATIKKVGGREAGKGHHKVIGITGEAPITFSNEQFALPYLVKMVQWWLIDHGVDFKKER